MDTEIVYEKSKNNHYKYFKTAILIFYKFNKGIDNNEDNLNITLIKTSKSNTFNCISTQVTDYDGNSIFALARFFAQNFNGVLNSSLLDKFARKTVVEAKEINYEKVEWYNLWDNSTFYSWLETLSNNVIQYDEFENEIIYFIETPELDLEYTNSQFKSLNIDLELNSFEYNFNEDENKNFINKFEPSLLHLLKLFDFKSHISESLNLIKLDKLDYYIIIGCKPQAENKLDQAGFFHFPSLLQGHYRRNNEKWLYIIAGDLNFPDANLLAKTKCVIIPGSHLKSYDVVDFLNKTREWIRNFNENFKKVKYLGLCFGSQIFFNSLEDGLCEKNNIKNHNEFINVEFLDKHFEHFVIKTETITITDDFWDVPFVKMSDVKPTKTLKIHQMHGDEITKYGKEFKVYASSESCKNEVFVSTDNRYFLFQGHPEYQREFNFSRICNSNNKLMNMLPKENIKEFYDSKRKELIDKFEKEDSIPLRSLCFSFLKN